LEDCRQQSCLELADAFSLLSKLWQTHVEKNTRLDLGMEPWKEEIEKDLTYLGEEMKGVKGKIEGVRVMVCSQDTSYPVRSYKLIKSQVKDKLKLRQISRTFILTFVAAVYLPFSFITVSTSSVTQISIAHRQSVFFRHERLRLSLAVIQLESF
jgi:hypothetical protein